MLTRDESPETEDWFFDARPYASENEWNLDAPPRTDDSFAVALAKAEPVPAPRPAREQGRIMVIGFSVVRL